MPLAAITAGEAIAAAGALGAGAAVYSANKQSGSAQSALSAEQQQQQQNQANQQPYLDAAKTTLPIIEQGLQPGGQFNRSLTTNDINSNIAPDYAFTLQQGQKAVNNAQASQGRYGSGAGLESLDQYTTGLAGQYANQAFNNYQTNLSGQYNRLSSLAGLGQTATGIIGGQSANQSQAIGNTYTQQGNANAAGIAGAANSLSSPLSTYGALGLAKQFSGTTANGTNNYAPVQEGSSQSYGTLGSFNNSAGGSSEFIG